MVLLSGMEFVDCTSEKVICCLMSTRKLNCLLDITIVCIGLFSPNTKNHNKLRIQTFLLPCYITLFQWAVSWSEHWNTLSWTGKVAHWRNSGVCTKNGRTHNWNAWHHVLLVVGFYEAPSNTPFLVLFTNSCSRPWQAINASVTKQRMLQLRLLREQRMLLWLLLCSFISCQPKKQLSK